MFTPTPKTAPATATPTPTPMVCGIDKLPMDHALRLERRMRDYSDMRGRALLTVYGDAPWHDSRGFAGWLQLIDRTFGLGADVTVPEPSRIPQ